MCVCLNIESYIEQSSPSEQSELILDDVVNPEQYLKKIKERLDECGVDDKMFDDTTLLMALSRNQMSVEMGLMELLRRDEVSSSQQEESSVAIELDAFDHDKCTDIPHTTSKSKNKQTNFRKMAPC